MTDVVTLQRFLALTDCQFVDRFGRTITAKDRGGDFDQQCRPAPRARWQDGGGARPASGWWWGMGSMSEIRGYVLRWGDIADLGDHLERFAPGCFTEPIGGVRLTLEHQDHLIAARGDRVRLDQDATGLWLEVEGNGSSDWRRFCSAVSAGARGASFTFDASAVSATATW